MRAPGNVLASVVCHAGRARRCLHPEICLKFLQPFEQLIFVGALFPVATFAYKNQPTMKSPPGCDLFVMASVEQDLTAALRSLASVPALAAAA